MLCIFISRDNTRNNHVNRERKYIYIYSTWYETILIDTDIKHDTCCWHNIKHDCYHAWYALLELHCSRLLVHQPWTVLFHACWQLATGCAFFLFLRVLITQQSRYIGVSGHNNEKNNLCWRHHFSATFSRDPAVQLYYRGQWDSLGKLRLTNAPALSSHSGKSW